VSATVFGRGDRATSSFLPQVVLATVLVAAMPVVVVWELSQRRTLTSLWSCLGVSIALSLAASLAGSAYWKRRHRPADLMFSELLLWNWLRRLHAERRLADTAALLIDAGVAPQGPASDRAQVPQMLKQLVLSFEALDSYTAGHSRRVARHADATAERMHLSEEERERIRLAAAVHDVGKLRVPQRILDKVTPLSEEELELVHAHAVDGAEMVSVLGDDALTAIVRHHHEWVDGSGYPDAIEAQAIPIGARIIAVADTYDAIIMPRPYRGPAPHKRAIGVLRAESGTHFDPDVVDAFIAAYAGRRAVLIWSALAIAVKRLLAWPRAVVGLSGGRPSTPVGNAMTGVTLGALATTAAAAALAHRAQTIAQTRPAPAALTSPASAPTGPIAAAPAPATAPRSRTHHSVRHARHPRAQHRRTPPSTPVAAVLPPPAAPVVSTPPASHPVPTAKPHHSAHPSPHKRPVTHQTRPRHKRTPPPAKAPPRHRKQRPPHPTAPQPTTSQPTTPQPTTPQPTTPQPTATVTPVATSPVPVAATIESVLLTV
jgi:hypothetical protein